MQNKNNAGTPAVINTNVAADPVQGNEAPTPAKGAAKKVVIPKKGAKINKPIVLKNTAGEDVDKEDYFFAFQEDNEALGYKEGDVVVPPYFNKVCGMPVEREDLVETFDKIFKPEDNFLFYKTYDKEVYIVIIPIKFTTEIGLEFNSQPGDFQKHSISFIVEGSANVDTLKAKLKRVANSIHYGNK